MRCTVCSGGRVSTFLDLDRIPVSCNRLCGTRDGAVSVPRADLRLGYCADCGHVYNVAFQPELVAYAPGYENSLSFSGRFREYADALVEDLIRRHALRGKDVVEIGCGRGDFLASLCARGGNRGWGFDPSHPDDTESRPHDGAGSVTIVREEYGRNHADVPADLVCCRHCLEHVADPVALLRTVREALDDRAPTPLFFEVPNLLYTLRDGGVWDLIYEHCSYFSAGSLARAFEEAGLAVHEVCDAFGGQFLTLHASSGDRPAPIAGVEPPDLAGHVEAFGERYRRRVGAWRRRLSDLAGAPSRIAVWGAGAKGATFLNVLDPDAERIDCAVDVNPHKQGGFVPGTGHPIVSPEDLAGAPPDVVVVMNPNYLDEILSETRELGIDAELMVG